MLVQSATGVTIYVRNCEHTLWLVAVPRDRVLDEGGVGEESEWVRGDALTWFFFFFTRSYRNSISILETCF